MLLNLVSNFCASSAEGAESLSYRFISYISYLFKFANFYFKIKWNRSVPFEEICKQTRHAFLSSTPERGLSCTVRLWPRTWRPSERRKLRTDPLWSNLSQRKLLLRGHPSLHMCPRWFYAPWVLRRSGETSTSVITCFNTLIDLLIYLLFFSLHFPLRIRPHSPVGHREGISHLAADGRWSCHPSIWQEWWPSPPSLSDGVWSPPGWFLGCAGLRWPQCEHAAAPWLPCCLGTPLWPAAKSREAKIKLTTNS